MPASFPFRSGRAPLKLALTLLAGALIPFCSQAQASAGAWDYICMVDHAADTGQEVGYLLLHVDLPITNKAAATATATTSSLGSVALKPVASAAANTTEAAIAAVADLGANAEQTVLSALAGEGNFDQAVTVVAAEAHAKRDKLRGLAEFLLARRSGDAEGFKQWTLNTRTLQTRATVDGESGATAVSYRRLVAEVRVQIKLGPDYRSVLAGLESRRDSDFRAAIDKVILATKKESNGGIDYGTYVSEVLSSLKNRKAPVPYTQRSKDAGLTNSAQ